MIMKQNTKLSENIMALKYVLDRYRQMGNGVMCQNLRRELRSSTLPSEAFSMKQSSVPLRTS